MYGRCCGFSQVQMVSLRGVLPTCAHACGPAFMRAAAPSPRELIRFRACLRVRRRRREEIGAGPVRGEDVLMAGPPLVVVDISVDASVRSDVTRGSAGCQERPPHGRPLLRRRSMTRAEI